MWSDIMIISKIMMAMFVLLWNMLKMGNWRDISIWGKIVIILWVSMKCYSGLYKCVMRSSIYMIRGYYIGILNAKIYSSLLLIKLKLVILGSPKIWKLLLIWLRLKLGHLVLWHHKFGKIKCIIKNQIYGVLAVFSTKWWLLTMHSNPKVPILLF